MTFSVAPPPPTPNTEQTAGNRERQILNFEQAKRFARENSTQVVRWKRKSSSWKGKPPKVHQQERAANAEPCFWEYYVQGALGYINKNVNIDIRLANGTMIRYHSICLGSTAMQEFLSEQMQTVPAGGVITLEEAPEMINVEVFPDQEGDDGDTRDLNRRLRQDWTYERIKDEAHSNDGRGQQESRVIIPIARDSRLKKKQENLRGAGTTRRGSAYRPSTISLQDHFPLELAFSMTVHKAQGRTIRRLILSLSAHPMFTLRLTWESLYVAMSRVRRRDDIRILLKDGETRENLAYVSDLEKDHYVGYYFSGFREEGDGLPPKWDQDLAVQAMEDAETEEGQDQ